MKNTETLARLREIKERIEAMEFRLESSEGCGAATCSAGRAADKDQGDAEEAQPMSAPLIAPEKAEDRDKTLIKVWNEAADDLMEKGLKYREDGVEHTANGLLAAAAAYQACAKNLAGFQSESRKANAAETLEHGTIWKSPSVTTDKNQKGS